MKYIPKLRRVEELLESQKYGRSERVRKDRNRGGLEVVENASGGEKKK